jgi:hypothetical protein
MGAGAARACLLNLLITLITAGAATGQTAMGQSPARPPIGDFGSQPDAMIFYVAHGGTAPAGLIAPTGSPLKAPCSLTATSG